MKFSFVICTYNREQYIANSLKSVCEQNFSNQDFEVIVVDNNSPDKTSDLCHEYINRYQHVQFRYILEVNQGISYARNRGIKEAAGKYIVFVDDDETINTDYLEKLDNYITQYPQAQLCATPVFPVYEAEKPRWLSHFTMRLITGYYYKGTQVKKLGAKDYPGTGHAIIEKVLFEKYGMFNTELGRKGNSLLGAEDKDMFLRLINNNIDCYYFPDIPIYHHIPESKTTNDFFQRLTYSIGKSERIRTLSLSKKEYQNRLFQEVIKWGVSIILCIGYTILLTPQKGIKLIQFRWNVTKGLLGK